MKVYHKTFAAHNTLITYGVWEAHQAEGWKKLFGTGTPPALFDVQGGVADVYYHEVFGTFRRILETQHKKDPRFFTKQMDLYQKQLASIHSIIDEHPSLPSIPALVAFTQQFQDAWISLDISYMPDYVALDSTSERRSAAIREQAFGFYIGADRLIRQMLEALLPELGALASYVTLEEIQTKTIPERRTLEARANHFIYFQGRVVTDVVLEAFCKRESIRIESVYAPLRKHIPGLVGSVGTTTGKARMIKSDADRATFIAGEVLVTDNLETDDLPLLGQASALVLDKGSYYGFGAIAARNLRKPCIFATDIATMVLQTGDKLCVNGETGCIQLQP